eukprot:136020_1
MERDNTFIKCEPRGPPQPSTVGFSCEHCAMEFNMKDKLIRHVANTHGDMLLPVKSEDRKSSTRDASCQNVFSRKSYLKRHLRIHSSLKPYACDVCQKAFSQKGCLNRHMRVHSGDKPYVCDVCQK